MGFVSLLISLTISDKYSCLNLSNQKVSAFLKGSYRNQATVLRTSEFRAPSRVPEK